MTTPDQPGWYDDPQDVNALRYWDGQGWTPHRERKLVSRPAPQPIAPPPTVPPPSPSPPPPPPSSTAGQAQWPPPTSPAGQVQSPPPGGGGPRRSRTPIVVVAVIVTAAVLAVAGVFGYKYFFARSDEDQIRALVATFDRTTTTRTPPD